MVTCQIPSVYVAWKCSKSLCWWVCKPILVLALVQTRILDLDLDHAEQFPFPLGLYESLKDIGPSVLPASAEQLTRHIQDPGLGWWET